MHLSSAGESAWNGHTLPGSTTPSRFTPYYVPAGAKSYDSDSPLIHYSGTWSDSFSGAYVNKGLKWTSHSGASVSFSFTGTGIEWFGNSGTSQGSADVYIDGKQVKTVSAFNSVDRKQQRIFSTFDLHNARHTLRLVNVGRRPDLGGGPILSVDAFVVTHSDENHPQTNMIASPTSDSQDLSVEHPVAAVTTQTSWNLTQRGTTGVSAMQLSIISPSHALIIDKVEHNPLDIDGHPAWAALYDLNTDAVIPLHMQSNSFCAGGAFLSNGTMINVGGNPVVSDNTSSADFGDLDGLQAVRILNPCLSDSADGCDMYENHSRDRLGSPRWYTTVTRISDGSAMVVGGSKKGGWINNATVNNPTIEYYPPKDIHGCNGLAIPSRFFNDTLNSNLFPHVFSLDADTVFVAANQDAMIYNWKTNTEQRLPQIPNGVRVTYPMAGTALLLPLSPQNNYTSEVLICGGSTIDDTKPGYEISSQDPASAQCSRMVLSDEGIQAGWQVEQMPQARLMPDAVQLPTGEIVIVNGAGSGISGYANVVNQVGQSNADNPVLTAVLYDPLAPVGQRFSSSGMPTSQIPRMYHSVASLTPSGDIMIAGSNPNLDRSEIKYGTEYRVEWLSPPYMTLTRPEIVMSKKGANLGFGQSLPLSVTGIQSGDNIIGEL